MARRAWLAVHGAWRSHTSISRLFLEIISETDIISLIDEPHINEPHIDEPHINEPHINEPHILSHILVSYIF